MTSTETAATKGTVLISGVGPGLGAALCRRFLAGGYGVAALARSSEFAAQLIDELGREIRLQFYACDVSDQSSVQTVTSAARSELGPFEVLVHNASGMRIAPFSDQSPDEFRKLWEVSCLGAVHCTKAVLPDMLSAGAGTILFTGATASLRGGANFAAFASAKFALRGLAQSLARAYGGSGIHVAHIIVDGLIRPEKAQCQSAPAAETCLNPQAIADQYMQLVQQERSAWTHELDLRPFTEKF